MCKLLIEECGASMARDRFGLLPIHDAVQNDHLEVRRYLHDKEIRELKEDAPKKRARSESFETQIAVGGRNRGDMGKLTIDHTMGNVFELALKEGVFSYSTVHTEVQHF